MNKRGPACRQAGFTLVELLITLTIIVLLALMAVGAINPGALIGRGNDARRKKDIGRIKTSFEEYFNDRNCYPDQALVDQLMNQANCNSGTIFSQLSPWPCDPVSRLPYFIVVEPDTGCPNWFKLFTKLDNLKDTDIPSGWTTGINRVGNGVVVYGQDEVNYGGSSTNVSWYDRSTGVGCNASLCSVISGGGTCQPTDSCSFAKGEACYYSFSGPNGNECRAECQVSACTR